MTHGGASTADETKAALRRRVRRSRRTRAERADVDERQADAVALTQQLLALVQERTGGRSCRVAAYRSMPTEPPTELLVQSLLDAGHEVIVPVTLPDLDLDWAGADQVTGVVAGLGVDLLGVDAVGGAEVVVTPGLAVDREGHRLGQGGGSYDRALARRARGALVVTLLYPGELLGDGEQVPAEDHDVPVDAVATPAEVWRAVKSGPTG